MWMSYYIHTVLLSQSLDVSKNLSVDDYQEYKHNKVVDADNRAIGSQQLVNAVHIDSSWLEQSIAVQPQGVHGTETPYILTPRAPKSIWLSPKQ